MDKLRLEVDSDCLVPDVLEDIPGSPNTHRRYKKSKKKKGSRKNEGRTILRGSPIGQFIKSDSLAFATNWSRMASKKTLRIAKTVHELSKSHENTKLAKSIIENLLYRIPDETMQSIPVSSIPPPVSSLLQILGYSIDEETDCLHLQSLQPKKLQTALESMHMIDTFDDVSIQYITEQTSPIALPRRLSTQSFDSEEEFKQSLSMPSTSLSYFEEHETHLSDLVLSASVPSGRHRRQRRRRRRERALQVRTQEQLLDEQLLFDFDDPLDDTPLDRKAESGLPEYILSALPVRRMSVEDTERSHRLDHRCRICLEPYEKDELVLRLPCLHQFHQQCIERWLATSTCCPQDRVEVTLPLL